MQIKLLESGEVVDAVLDKEKQMACYLNIETDDFDTITSDQFEIIPEPEDEDIEEDIDEDEVEDTEEDIDEIEIVEETSTQIAASDIAQSLTSFASVFGKNLKTITFEFK